MLLATMDSPKLRLCLIAVVCCGLVIVCGSLSFDGSINSNINKKNAFDFRNNNRNSNIRIQSNGNGKSRPVANHRTIFRRTDNVVCFLSRKKNGNSNTNSNHDDHPEYNSNANTNSNSNANDTLRDDAEYELLLEYSIDSFLRGDYDRTFAEDAASPLPGLSPRDTVDAALRSLRNLNDPEPFHGAAVLLRFCVELGRGERWGTSATSSANASANANTGTNAANHRNGNKSSPSTSTSGFSLSWKELLRGALTPTMLARRIRASEDFSGLLDWSELDVTEDGANSNSNTAFVTAALCFGDETENDTDTTTNNGNVNGNVNGNGNTHLNTSPIRYRFKLAKMLGGVWLIDSVRRTSARASTTNSTTASTATTTRRRKQPVAGAPKEREKRRRQQQQQQQQKQRDRPIRKKRKGEGEKENNDED
mmetsp:Transcript_11217/g.23694  ORF Transcript_11217/g.23694 Transcript_11217/m.23694 type:complete len:422 (+) Transcript_11217:272-1537(+)